MMRQHLSIIKNKKYSRNIFSNSLKKTFGSSVIKIDYDELINPCINLHEEIHNSFGREGLGFLVVKNIPNYVNARENVLGNGYKLSKLNDNYLKTLEKPETNYIVGWSKGKAFTENKYEYLSSSFYARTQSDHLPYKNDPEMEKISKNVWPEEYLIPSFKKSYVEMGTIMINTQINVLRHIDKYLLFDSTIKIVDY